MTLYLAEIELSEGGEDALVASLDKLAAQARESNGQLIEAQAGKEAHRAFVILETDSADNAQRIIESAGLGQTGVKEVQLVGQDLDHVRENAAKANYLVEWSLPEGLTLEKYLARKAQQTPKYALVPEVSFERTYVCTDMSKCLCFYDSPDEDAVLRAREAVETPLDSVTTIKKVG